ncbi:facilitated trehalose transporter Tret1-like isoform X2 [Leptopilina boulardi]|uniref:facilitated trehalose transporter Tret1-like isoform X2 n=1 Tax=Leptopilina boulardi TaxID=63433 RepID=UPI0021F543CE|nr:facilitated trehalose transporter Tret1-like isoform X2 [Leptopilina boulardi]XP_051159120.1 facilitated trehalose transporter Tret1-like isoform X2 [Leptopilina boulardi]
MKVNFIRSFFKKNYVWKVPSEKNDTSEILGKSKNNWMQYMAVISVSTMSIASGAFEMWLSPALPYIKSTDFKFQVSSDQISWIVSLFNIGEIIGFLVHPFFINRIGRKYTLLASAVPQLLASILVFIAENVTTLYAARIIGGIGFGAGSIVQNFYISEIAEKDIRGRLGAFPALGFLIGTMSILLTGAFSTYDGMNLTILSFPLIFMVSISFMPESPYFYLQRNQDEKAMKILTKLRGVNDSKSLELELSKIKEAIIEDKKNKKFILRNLIETKRHRKSLIIVAILKIAVAFSGARVIAMYFQVIFSYTGFTLGPQYIMLIMAPVVAVLIVPTIVLVDYLGRRLIILYSSIACSLGLFIVGFFFFWKDHIDSNDINLFSWIPLIALVILDIGCIALAATAGILSVELFSIQVKSTALALLFLEGQLLEFLIKLTFENITNNIGIHGTLWIYCALCFGVSLIGFYVTPETKGKTLEEIQLLLD